MRPTDEQRMLFQSLIQRGYHIEFTSHADAILEHDFPETAGELEAALLRTIIPVEEIIAGGGGEAANTQRLRKLLSDSGWPKATFTVEKRINNVPSESQSHEIDHVRELYAAGKLFRIALEIEWNNKDPFYDRDLENFKRLHADGAISIGAIITRGESLHRNMRAIVKRFLEEHNVNSLNDFAEWGYSPTHKQRELITQRTTRKESPVPFRDALADKFVGDKFGEATTHWRKLRDRIDRGVGSPCPLVLIGMPASVVMFNGSPFEAADGDEVDEDE